MLLCDLFGIHGLLVERLAPAADVAVAPLYGAEGCLVEGLYGLAIALFEGDRCYTISSPADGQSFSQVKVNTDRLSCTISR
jgi:hypothetical protein